MQEKLEKSWFQCFKKKKKFENSEMDWPQEKW